MRQSMLTDDQARFLREEKESLSEIRLALAGIDAPREALTTLQDAILQLDELFLMVVVGEFKPEKAPWSMPCWARGSCSKAPRPPLRA